MSWAVIVNNIAALEILMDCGYVRAAILVGMGAGLRSAVATFVLKGVGLGTGLGTLDGVVDVMNEVLGKGA